MSFIRTKASAILPALVLMMLAIGATNKSYRFFVHSESPLRYVDLENCAEEFAGTSLACEDIALLSERERLLTPSASQPRNRAFKLSPSDQYDAGAWSSNEPYQYFSANGQYVQRSNVIPPPIFEFSGENLEVGSIRILNGAKDDQVYFEFDVEPSFSSPRLWRWPALKPKTVRVDSHAAVGAELDLFNFATANTSGLSRVIDLPFPLTLMAAPYSVQSPFRSMQSLVALAVREVERKYGDADPPESPMQTEIARVLHRYLQHGFLIGSDSYNKPPVETFLARNGECGNLNALAQALVELAGMKARLVAGFNPKLRQIMPVSGHTLLEVRYPEGWGILDTYLDLFAPDVSTADLPGSWLADKAVLSIDNTRFDPALYGTSVTLGQIFQYRSYGDGAQRMPMQSLVQLGGREAEYGLNWPARSGVNISSKSLLEALPDSIGVYVRARFIRSRCIGSWNYSCGDPDALASTWTVKRLTIPLG